MTRPNIQIDDEIREMTEEEYARQLESGWTLESSEPSEPFVSGDPVETEEPIVPERPFWP